ncbi:MAG TPA: tetratricopeptide repeat protein [Gammaproteobacteria bacterium]|nr:tetratricopeptide repeat protein [Gammaproteobacteria bacterium]
MSGTILATPGYAASIDPAVNTLQQQWAKARYQTPKEQRQDALETLSKQAAALTAQHPDSAEALTWEGIILSTLAGEKGGFSALSLVKKARQQLLKAETIKPDALQGSIFTSLGSLYYQVPGWPLAFGDNKKARQYLEKGLKINPQGIDANYFYGDFLYQRGEYKKAEITLQKALKAPPRTGRALADSGRRKEIELLLKKVKSNF